MNDAIRRRSSAVRSRRDAHVVRALDYLLKIEEPLSAHVVIAVDELRHELNGLDAKALADLAWYFGEDKLAQTRGIS